MTGIEGKVFLYNLLSMKLIDERNVELAVRFSDFVYGQIKDVNLRTLDHLNAKAYYFMGLAYEKAGKLGTLRELLFEGYRSACIRLDQISQVTILNLILRSYLKENLVEQAANLISISKDAYPENANNN